ncbi:MAG: hypothetical protein JST40_03490 [Armatimonadetes bacterium]|nr:hypothetical protein [Armatimonadota bacterium]
MPESPYEPSDNLKREIEELERHLDAAAEAPEEPMTEERLEEIEAHLEENLKAAMGELPDVPTDEEIERRIKEATGGKTIQEAREDFEKATQPKQESGGIYSGTANGLQLAYMLLAPPIALFLVGKLMDSGRTEPFWSTWLALAGVIIGLVAMVWRVNNLNK